MPLIIIQTHKDPAIGAMLRQTWIHLHPDYEYRFYSDDHCRQFFSQCMPELLPTYDKLPLPVQYDICITAHGKLNLLPGIRQNWRRRGKNSGNNAHRPSERNRGLVCSIFFASDKHAIFSATMSSLGLKTTCAGLSGVCSTRWIYL